MTLRTALGQSKILTFGLLAVAAWTVVVWFRVLSVSESFLTSGTPIVRPATPVGQVGVSGLVGLLVMLAFLGFLVVLWSEVGEGEPGPQTFPPEE